ncbi:uncharacterized protein BDZ99DRAFT_266245 [Mytilinidion resinicola]|uniref:Uncharacterized protein n=1 Tax=Mytilinidion resinicola TaxID=574789 RepID=A0A6A6YTX9_9PEZI|nr:uncharacterized protein BDZ99DRAFT_266245 [Mytilinidion resinicola]KAF2812416.1 hypothetical protein BDZ99DRAFT_266245 [Mytilinidion resinicola]
MSSIFCCSQVGPYKSRFLNHESKFQEFVQWAAFPAASSVEEQKDVVLLLSELGYPYVVQVVRQVNYGPIESKRYFVVTKGKDGKEPFVEVTEDHLIQGNYEKLNS